MSPAPSAAVTGAQDIVQRLRGQYAMGPHLPNGDPEFGWRQFEATPINKEAADVIEALRAAADSPYVTTRLAEAADRAAKAEARAEKAEALYVGLIQKYHGLTAFYDDHVGTPCEQVRHEHQVAELTRKLNEARGATRDLVDYLASHSNGFGLAPKIRALAAVLAPETGKETSDER